MNLAAYLEPVINRLLAMDSATLQPLAKFDDSVIAVELLNTTFVLYITLLPTGVRLAPLSDREPDVRIAGTPTQFIRYIVAMKRGDPAQAGGLQISGDAALAQAFQTALKNLELDWEEELSQWIGDSLAHQAGRAANKTAGMFRHAGKTLGMDISEYLRYETETLPDRETVAEFNASVDDLRNDVERLKARIRRLQAAGGE